MNFFFFVAEEVREILASLGLRTLDEAIGRVDLLGAEHAIEHWKARGVDLTHILAHIELPRGRAAPAREGRRRRCSRTRWTGSSSSARARSSRLRLSLGLPAATGKRCAPTRSREGSRRARGDRAADPQRQPLCRRHPLEPHRAGAWREGPAARLDRGRLRGLRRTELRRLAGARRHLRRWRATPTTTPARDSPAVCSRCARRASMASHFVAQENVIVGNTVLYGATAGRAFFRGLAGERFARAQLGRLDGRGGRGRPRLRVHDRRARGRARPHRPQLRRRDERRDRLRARRGRSFPARCNMGMVGFEEISPRPTRSSCAR